MICKRRKTLHILIIFVLVSGATVVMLLNITPLNIVQQKRLIITNNHQIGYATPEVGIHPIAIDHSHNSTHLISNQPYFPSGRSRNQTHENKPITIQITGRLGNNMFQYASLLGVAHINRRIPYILPTSDLSRVFQVTKAAELLPSVSWVDIFSELYGIYNSSYQSLPENPLLLHGYFQSYKYFRHIGRIIQREFAFQPYIAQAADTILNQLPAFHQNVTRVGVHVRRGDFLSRTEIRLGGRVAPYSYFQKAFAWMRNRRKRVIFLVTTDDVEWTRAYLVDPDVIIMPFAPAAVHLSLLTKCQHTIMSVGTFGWWAGWLAGGDVIYYNQPLVPGSWKGQRMKMDDYYPKHWIGLPS